MHLQHLFAGLTNRTPRELIASLIRGYTARQMTCELRRLRRKRLIRRIPRTQRYKLTGEGRRLAVYLTKTYTRIVNPSLADLDPALPPHMVQRRPTRPSMTSVRESTPSPHRPDSHHGLKR